MEKIKSLLPLADLVSRISHAREISTRELCNDFGMKKEELAQLIFSISVKRRLRRQNALPLADIGLSCVLKIEEKLRKRLKETLPLRASESSWAGGAYFRVVISTKRQNGDWGFGCSRMDVYTWVEYSSNGKWSGNSTRHTLYLMPSDTFAVIGGYFTIFPKSANGAPCSCKWYVQGRGFTIREKVGFLVDGVHVEKKAKILDIESAIKKVRKL